MYSSFIILRLHHWVNIDLFCDLHTTISYACLVVLSACLPNLLRQSCLFALARSRLFFSRACPWRSTWSKSTCAPAKTFCTLAIFSYANSSCAISLGDCATSILFHACRQCVCLRIRPSSDAKATRRRSKVPPCPLSKE